KICDPLCLFGILACEGRVQGFNYFRLFAPAEKRTGYLLIPPIDFIPPTRVALDFTKPAESLACGIAKHKPLIAQRAVEQRFGHIRAELQRHFEFIECILDLALLNETDTKVVVSLRAFGCACNHAPEVPLRFRELVVFAKKQASIW